MSSQANSDYQSWGRTVEARHSIFRIPYRSDALPTTNGKKMLAYGLGRSYGDSCLNDGGLLIVSDRLKRFISFDSDNGVLCCEAGVTFAEILPLITERGWFLPVTPGTKFVTIGGAVANDIHGKNHHCAGTIGRYIRRFELLRSDGQRYLCSHDHNREWFCATIGGLGLTGLIVWVELQLMPINNCWITAEMIKFRNLGQFFELCAQSASYHYTVAWIDCLATGKSLARGIFMRGDHAPPLANSSFTSNTNKQIHLPFEMPALLLNRFTLKAFNFLYYHKQVSTKIQRLVHLDSFFYPLDAIANWNRLYGRRGFFQYQCLVPYDNHNAIRNILQIIAESGLGSFLAVLKVFGDLSSPGMLSFPKKGVTLCLDFANHGRRVLELFERLDQIVRSERGAVYPAKDSRMSATSFQTYFPQWRSFSKYLDRNFSSNFWRRVSE